MDVMDNTPVPADHSAAVPSTVSSALPQVLDDAVYLPAGRQIAAESEEFDSLLRRHLPAEILPDVLTNWRGVSARTSRLRLFAAVLFLLVSAALLYYFFPAAVHPDLAQHGGLEIKYTGSALPFSPLNRQAAAAYDRGDYNAVCKILKDEVEKIIREGDSNSYILAFRYFQAVRQLHGKNVGWSDDEETKRILSAATDLLGKLMKKDPDTPAWAQFHFELSPRIRRSLDYEQVARRLLQDARYREEIRVHQHNADIALKALNKLGPITNKGKFSQAELKKFREDYDLFRVKILLSQWLLKGFPKLPDNENDAGVTEREEALMIARKHENSACEDFWRARLFIAETLLRKDTLVNHIYWNCRYHTSKKALEAEVIKCKERLKER